MVSVVWDEYVRRTAKDEPKGKILDDLGVQRYCCRTVILTQPRLLPEILALDAQIETPVPTTTEE